MRAITQNTAAYLDLVGDAGEYLQKASDEGKVRACTSFMTPQAAPSCVRVPARGLGSNYQLVVVQVQRLREAALKIIELHNLANDNTEVLQRLQRSYVHSPTAETDFSRLLSEGIEERQATSRRVSLLCSAATLGKLVPPA